MSRPDLVFCANQVLPIPAAATADGVARIVPSRMRWPSRRGEVPLVSAHLARAGYAITGWPFPLDTASGWTALDPGHVVSPRG